MIAEIVDTLPLSDERERGRHRGDREDRVARSTAIGLVSLLVFAWAATGMMGALRLGLEVAMRVERSRPIVRASSST